MKGRRPTQRLISALAISSVNGWFSSPFSITRKTTFFWLSFEWSSSGTKIYLFHIYLFLNNYFNLHYLIINFYFIFYFWKLSYWKNLIWNGKLLCRISSIAFKMAAIEVTCLLIVVFRRFLSGYYSLKTYCVWVYDLFPLHDFLFRETIRVKYPIILWKLSYTTKGIWKLLLLFFANLVLFANLWENLWIK